jgi:hypothetical protein
LVRTWGFRSPSNISYWFGYLVDELPFVAVYCIVASTVLAFSHGDIDSAGGWVAFGLAVLMTVGLAVVIWRGLQVRGPTGSRPPRTDRSIRRHLRSVRREVFEGGIQRVWP